MLSAEFRPCFKEELNITRDLEPVILIEVNIGDVASRIVIQRETELVLVIFYS